MDLSLFESYSRRIINNCRKVILGKDDIIEKVIICYLCSGHILLEDVPGTGKTMLLRAFSRSVGGKFSRIQFTPDLLPSDLTGINFFNMKSQEFEFRPGPLFAQIILADEINRATPRTQAAFLEAMEQLKRCDKDIAPAIAKSLWTFARLAPSLCWYLKRLCCRLSDPQFIQ